MDTKPRPHIKDSGGVRRPGGRPLSRRHFYLCCIAGAVYAATSGWLTPSQVFAEARGLVTLFKDSAAVSAIVTHKLRNNIAVLEGSGGNIVALTGSDGKVHIDAGIDVPRPQIAKALTDLDPEPITHLVNTHWHFDHTSGNDWLHTAGAKIIAQKNTRKHLSEVQRVADWDYNFLPLPATNPSSRNSAICSLPSGKMSLLSRTKEDRGRKPWQLNWLPLLIRNGAVPSSTAAFHQNGI